MKAVIPPDQFVPEHPWELIGQARPLAGRLLRHMRRLRQQDDARLKMVFYGEPGCGKSTLANMVAGSLAAHPTEILSVNGRDLTIDEVRRWMDSAAYGSLFNGWQIKLINEMDLVPLAAQELMLTYLDDLRPHMAILGTSNARAETLSERFQTRFQQIRVASPPAEDIAEFLRKGWPVPKHAANFIAVGCAGNVRKALLEASTFLSLGVLPEQRPQNGANGKSSTHVEAAKTYWNQVRAGLRPAPGTANN